MKVGDTLTVSGWRARDGGTLGPLARDHVAERREDDVRSAGRHGRRRQRSGRRRPMTRALDRGRARRRRCVGARGGASAARRRSASNVPRTADGKPDLTGVWQGGSTQPGAWDEANAGLGVGGTGRDPNARRRRLVERSTGRTRRRAVPRLGRAESARGVQSPRHRRSDRPVSAGGYSAQRHARPVPATVRPDADAARDPLRVHEHVSRDSVRRGASRRHAAELHGQLGRALGRRYARRRRRPASTTRRGSPARARSTRTRCTSSSATRASAKIASTTK